MAIREDISLRGLLHDPSVRLLMGRNGVRVGEVARTMVAARAAMRADGGRRRPGSPAGEQAWSPTLGRVSALLAQAADMLAEARSADALRSAVAFNLGLWRGIARMLATDRASRLSDDERRLLGAHAAYVLTGSGIGPCPDDAHIETFITLARRDSEWLAALGEAVALDDEGDGGAGMKKAESAA